MRTMIASAVMLALAAGAAGAQNQSLGALKPRGISASSDLTPCQPQGSATLQYCTVGGLGGGVLGPYPLSLYSPAGQWLYATAGYAGGVAVSGYQNIIAIGDGALNPATHTNPAKCTNAASNPNFCGDEVALGTWTLHTDIDGRDNTAVGDHALTNLSHGVENVGIGSSALANIRNANDITGVGTSACQNVFNTAGPLECIGVSALQNAGSNSQYSAALGFQAGLNATDVEHSALLGPAAGYAATYIWGSTLVGRSACNSVTSISNSVCIGYGTASGPASGTMSNKLWIGGAVTPLIYGDFSAGHVGIGTTTLDGIAALTVPSVVASFVRTAPTTVSGLSTSDPTPSAGDRAFVTDAASCTFNSAVSGGGSVKCPVVYTGSGWVAG